MEIQNQKQNLCIGNTIEAAQIQQNRENHSISHIATFQPQKEDVLLEDHLQQSAKDRNETSMVSLQEYQEKKFFPQYLGQDFNIVQKFVFWHLTKYSLLLKKNVLDKGDSIKDKHLPLLSLSEDITKTVQHSQEKIKGKIFITVYYLIFEVFFGELKWVTTTCILVYSLESFARNGVSFVMSKIISSVAQQNIQQAYLYAVLLIFMNICCVFCRHHGYNQAMIFSSKARMALINFVYIKLTDLSSYSIKEANIGKILNLISGDINHLENIFINVFQSSVILITLIFGCYILWDRFEGLIGLLVLVIIFIAYPIQVTLQSFNSKTLILQKQFQDQRLKLTNELIEGIRLIKMYAWEQAFEKMISTMRSKEFICILKINLRTSIDRLFSLVSQIWSSLIFFLILYYGGYRKKMDVAEMISTIQLLTFFKFSCVYMVSYGIQSVISIKVSFERIANILNIQNCEMQNLDTIVVDDQKLQNEIVPRIQLKNFCSYWTSKVTDQTLPVLKDINLSINQGESWAFIGRVGCGKSTLLSAFLFEIPAYKGSFQIDGKERDKGNLSISYVEQEPFIFPDTIRKNILFGRQYDKALYQNVLHASQLEADLQLMKFQDHTEIGERGTTLSGGQKARLSLARALYQQADLYLFDDPLSAVDAIVAKNIFHMAIKEFIFEYQVQMNPEKPKPIVLLVTHQIQYAVECDKIAILDGGKLVTKGSYDEIKDNLYMINEDLAQQLNNTKQQQQQEFVRPLISKRTKLLNSKTNNLTGDEADQSQIIDKKTYFRYFKYWNLISIIAIFCLEAGSEILINLYQRIISLFEVYSKDNKIDDAYQLIGILTIGLLLCNFFKYLINTISVQNTTQEIHKQMLSSLSVSPVSYFDTNPSGRIINRFSNDLSLCDNQTNSVILDILENMGSFIFALITLAILQPYFLIMIIFILIADLYQFNYSKKIISQLKEIELMQRSPLFDFLKKTLGGVIQVRVYGQQKWFNKQFLELSNKCNLNSLTYYYSTRCFGFNVDMIGFIAQTVGIYLFLTLSQDNTAILSQGLLLLTTYNLGLQWGLRQMIIFDTQMNSYNRMFQIIDIEPEAPHKQPEDEKHPEFPRTGDVKFENVHMRYRKNSDLVLKGLTFSLKSGEKIGCVGRTGAGKSSILQVIFRMSEIEVEQQSILEIDGIDLRKLGLHKLRASIGIIPQSPFLFTGTIRRNLDPFDQYQDSDLWRALEETDLISHVKVFKKGLLTDMSDVNSIFSVGQKQLICLARVILSQKKIIVLDEATANVDMKTDDFIQEALKKKFSDCTLITIAHRLNTIADYDKVMVVNEGQVLEFDTPFNLLALSDDSLSIDKHTEFSRLVKNTGQQNAQAIFEIAKQKNEQKFVNI